jgi:DNA-binding beta-propeller fold protein YncE
MKRGNKYYFLILLTISALVSFSQQTVSTLQVPAGDLYTQIKEEGKTVLPSGRFLTPAGKIVRITNDPFGMAVSPDGEKIVTLHNGVFTLIHRADLSIVRVPSYDKSIASPFSNGSFLGVAFSGDSKKVFLSGGDNGAVIIYDLERWERIDSMSLNGMFNGVDYEDSFTSDLLYLPENNELLILDRGNFRMVRMDLHTRKITASIPTGRQPFGLSVNPEHTIAFVANVGMYAYPLLPGITEKNADNLMLPFHPYGDNTEASIHGYDYKGRKIPGVGSPLAKEAMSVYTIDLHTNKIIDRYKPGHQIGQMVEGAEVVGGASPNSIAVGKQLAFVTNATNDNISVIDYRQHRIIGHIPIKVDARIDHYRGLLPFGICLSRDEKTLYVALLGFNAVAVIDVPTQTTKGLITTGWGPAKVQLSADNKEIYIITCRGYGAGPNGGKDFVAPIQGTYIGDIQLGSFQKLAVPDAEELKSYTRQVVSNTFLQTSVLVDKKQPLPPLPAVYSGPIKYIVYITKENRTYDEVLGQLPGARGDSTLARFGIQVMLPEAKDQLVRVNVAPNHLKMARQFAFSDNFYCDSDASIHGHHWMMGVIPNEWVETNSSVSKTAKIFSKAPGRRFPGSTGSMDPEDYAERGGLWEALERSHVSFYNFGEANETAHVREAWMDTATGAAHPVMVPMQKALWSRTSHDYAGFNTNIPDQFRMEQFEREFTRMWLKGKAKMPQLLTIQVPNDHTADPRPADGYRYRHSFVADNDLALGRLLHFLSRTLYWKQMLVIITEDDPQGGVDHIDAHRSILMMAGPYVKHGYVSHTHANFGSILKVIYNILGVPYVNQYDATASLLQDFFTGQPDYTPYALVFPSKEVFDPQESMKRYHRGIDWRKIMQGPDMDDEREIRKAHYATQ